MKHLCLILFILVYFNALHSMDTTSDRTNISYLPQEIIAQIAGQLTPTQKNILMRACKSFCACIKNRELILRTNPSTVSLFDKEKAMFKYAYANNVGMMQFLLENGVSANCENVLNMTPFHITSDQRNIEAMQLLANFGADVKKLKPQLHPFHEAAYKGDEEVVKFFLNLKDFNPDIPYLTITPLCIASFEGHINVATLLINAGANVNLPINNGSTPLCFAAHSGYTDIAKLLIKANANINHANSDEWTPLCSAARYGYTDIAKLLLAAHAKINHANNNGWTPLCFAARCGYTDIVELLLAARASVNLANNNGWTPLCFAIRYGYTDMVELLLAAHANVNHANNDGWTPLCFATYFGNVKIVKLLLDKEANIHCVLTKGDTPLVIAQKQGHIEVVEILQERLENEMKQKPIAQTAGHAVTKNLSQEKNEQENCAIQ